MPETLLVVMMQSMQFDERQAFFAGQKRTRTPVFR